MIYSTFLGGIVTTSLTGSDPWLKKQMNKQYHCPTFHIQPQAWEAPHSIFFWPFLHSPHLPWVHPPTAWACYLQRQCSPHLQRHTRGPIPTHNPFNEDFPLLTACPVGGCIFNMLPGLRCAALGINIVLHIDSAQHLMPSNCNDIAAPTTTFLDLDLSFYLRTTPLQHCHTKFHDAAYIWNSNIPTQPACHLSLTTLTLALALHWYPTTSPTLLTWCSRQTLRLASFLHSIAIKHCRCRGLSINFYQISFKFLFVKTQYLDKI